MPSKTNDKENPSFYSVIPAFVRYDKSLSPNAKLLYGEITSLANKLGYCWASNSYFADLYGVQKSSVTNWIKSLADAGFIKVEYVYADGKPNIERRKIFISHPMPFLEEPSEINEDSGPANNDGDGGQIFDQGGQLNDQGVVKFSGGGGQKTGEIILKANNKTAVVVDRAAQKTEIPPTGETATAFSNEEVEKLRLHFSSLDGSLAFDGSFYPKVLSFLSERGLSFDYVSWLYRYCSIENSKKRCLGNLSGYLFRVLLEPRYADLYLKSKGLSKPAQKQPETVDCPVCGASFDGSLLYCPTCRFDRSLFSDGKMVEREKKLFSMPKEAKAAYYEELVALNKLTGLIELSSIILKKNVLDRKYGLI